MQRVLALGVGLLALAGAACETNDIGKLCRDSTGRDMLLGDVPPAEIRSSEAYLQEVVATDPAFPCEELICVASQGRGGYCSKKCDSDVGCPDGFECRAIQPIGEHAGDKYCAWKACAEAADCGGGKDDFCCDSVPQSDPDPNRLLELCNFSKDGKCG